MNRLKLNFKLETAVERNQFLQEYLQESQFKKEPLTKEEMETCANYVLWGKDIDGKNAVQKKEIEIETRYKTWNQRKEEESLETLLETPTFNEQSILPPIEAIPKYKREVFDREKALKSAPDGTKETLEALFREIDTLELLLNFYDEEKGKRINPPREELTKQFSEKEKDSLRAKAKKLSQRDYLKLRHLLVEKRREQYSIKDSYSGMLQTLVPPPYMAPESLIIGEDVPVFPLGVIKGKEDKMFPNFRNVDSFQYTQKDLELISNQFWGIKKEEETLGKNQFYFSFLEQEHIYRLLLMYVELDLEENGVESLVPELIETLEYYIEQAELTDVQKAVLEMKIQHLDNCNIARIVNEKFDKSYTVNYISTIFKQQIVKKIIAAASLHSLIIENIFYPENFKKCSRCGDSLLKDANFFMRKSNASDGFMGRCKKCDKEIRGGYKKK